MKALRSFTVRPHLPEPLTDLDRIASNLRWSWNRDARHLFASIDPASWDRTNHDPRRVLAEVPTARLEELAADPDFLERLAAATASLDTYLGEPRWYQRNLVDSALGQSKVGYFSPEFGISEALPQYSGGLGVLAGDHLKASSDLGVPLVAVGLFYRHGYFRQALTVDGWQQERFPDLDPYALALERRDPRIEVRLGDRTLVAQIWAATVGRITLYLLDADIPDNPPDLQLVTDRLYGGDVEHRLRQEILLGMGGVRALEALGEDVTVFHTNEGHAGFLGLERIRALMQRDGLDFAAALESVRAGAVFTTHTPVPAGIDQFPRDLMERYFSGWANDCGLSVDELMALGHRPGAEPDERFNMAVMGMRLAAFRNGVSALHGEVSRHMFADLWPGVPERETPVGHITNGVHGDTWVSAEMHALFSKSVGSNWEQADADAWRSIRSVEPAELWQAHTAARHRMFEHVRDRVRAAGDAAGRTPSDLAWVDDALDPRALTICFARRMATYKRAALLLSQPERLRALLTDEARPVQFVFAGKAHPADDRGKELIRQIVAFSHDPAIRRHFVFVEDYDMGLARSLVQGADVWLNTPVRPMEASGTSGMKAVFNGALHCSVLDGWWAECFVRAGEENGKVPNGWAISSAEGVADEHRRTELEANGLFELLETQLVPAFHDQAEDGTPLHWVALMKESLASLAPFVGAHRMVRDYLQDLYLPAAERCTVLGSDDHRAARELASFVRRLRDEFPKVSIASVETGEDTADLGSTREVTAWVGLGDALAPDEVEVQLLSGRVGQSGELEAPATTVMGLAESQPGGHHRFVGRADLAVAGRMGVTVRVVPSHPMVHTALDLGHVAWAG